MGKGIDQRHNLLGVVPMGYDQEVKAVVCSPISPLAAGSVKLFGVFWRAEPEGQICFPSGATVKVQRRRDNTLIVSNAT